MTISERLIASSVYGLWQSISSPQVAIGSYSRLPWLQQAAVAGGSSTGHRRRRTGTEQNLHLSLNSLQAPPLAQGQRVYWNPREGAAVVGDCTVASVRALAADDLLVRSVAVDDS